MCLNYMFLILVIFLIDKRRPSMYLLTVSESGLVPCFQEAGHFIQGALKKINNSLDFVSFFVPEIQFALYCRHLCSKMAILMCYHVIIMKFVFSKIVHYRIGPEYFKFWGASRKILLRTRA